MVERQTNIHHFLFERKRYSGKPFNALRQALTAEVQIEWHKELHANLGQPPKPTRPLAHNILNNLDGQRLTQPFDNVFATVDYLQRVGNTETIPLAEHLLLQLGYVAGVNYE